jgi:hypothetical protein
MVLVFADALCWLSDHCAACNQEIPVANPSHVPSIRIDGERRPICAPCFMRWNDIHRVSQGLPPVELHPDAYNPEQEGTE